jgi:protease-4
MWTGTKDYTPAQWARFQAWLDRVYVDFTGKVAEGRKLPKERVLEIAKGRIWTGEDAKERGLVDELGGFPKALSLAKQAAGIPESEGVKLRVFPAKQSAFDAFFGETPDSSERQVIIGTVKAIQPFARRLRMLDGGSRRGVLSMPEIEVKY